MEGLNVKVSQEIEQRLLHNQRIINLRLPSYGNGFCGQLFLKNYNVYYYDLALGKIHLKKSLSKTVVGFFKWILKCIVFAIELIFPIFAISPSQILSLFFEGTEAGQALIENVSQKGFSSLSSLSKHIKIRKKPYKHYKKIKKVIYAVIDEKTAAQCISALQLLAELINAKYICNCSLVLLSKIKLLSPPQEILDLYGDDEKNKFVANFKTSFLDYLLNENYIKATHFIKELIGGNDLNVNMFEFIIQCLAFCYRNLNEDEFTSLFEDSDFNVNTHLYFGKTISFIENSGQDKNFLRFCFIFLEKYYNERPKISQDGLTVAFKRIVTKARDALTSKDDFLSAVKLFAKYSPSEETVDEYIVASIHTEYIKNRINDECISAIKEYEKFVPRANLFLRVLALNKIDNPNKGEIISLLKTVSDFKQVNPVVQLCFMYHLVNPVYKNGCCTEEFLNEYKILYNQALESNCNVSLLCLFGAQFLLFYATVEDSKIRKNFARFSTILLDNITQNKVLLENKKVYLKIMRSLNGIHVDNFKDNLARMKNFEKDAEQYVLENILYKINLGAVCAFNTEYKAALNTYKKIRKNVLKHMPLSICASYFNNYEVFKYLNNPSKANAQLSLSRIEKFITQNYTSFSVTEELIHLKINFLIFSMIPEIYNDAVDEYLARIEQTIKELQENNCIMDETAEYARQDAKESIQKYLATKEEYY